MAHLRQSGTETRSVHLGHYPKSRCFLQIIIFSNVYAIANLPDRGLNVKNCC